MLPSQIVLTRKRVAELVFMFALLFAVLNVEKVNNCFSLCSSIHIR